MKTYCITITDNQVSEVGYANCVSSANAVGIDFEIQRFEATTPDQVDRWLRGNRIKWNYPWDQPVVDFASGLVKTPYPTRNPQARIACAISHYRLWEQCAINNDPILILEHDAEFVNRLTDEVFGGCPYQIVGINDPRGATRRSQQFYNQIISMGDWIGPVPKVDDLKVPQGLAGNSAYVIWPRGARHLLKLVEQYGLWPNDALMCQQLVPLMGVTKVMFTRVNKMRSTTTL